MSLFRKPKKIQRRVFCGDDDDDGDPEPPPPPIISQNRKENKPVKSIQLLSFADEEEDGEVFKVKKSSQSKKLAKRREREKRRGPDNDDTNKFDSIDGDQERQEEKVTEKPKKKVTLEGLILSGREALAADGDGDLSSSENEEDSRGFHRYRAENVRAALAVAPGHIPDAALIHAARKTRQQARELGDFVPITSDKSPGPGSRLRRDDDMDDDDDEDEGRIEVRGLELPSDKPKRTTAAAASDDDMNSEADEWEEQQMQKAVPAIADITAALGTSELNPFAVAPPPPPRADAPQLRALLAPGRAAPATANDLVDALQERLSELSASRGSALERRERCRERLVGAARVRESRAARAPALDAAYRRAQAVRGYVTDLIECLDEKMPQLEALEARALALHRRRCSYLVERRRADVRDQAHDVLALAGRGGVARPPEDPEAARRAAEREGRRRARRLKREAAGAAHRDGDSSDDDLPPATAHALNAAAEEIRREAGSLFADALPAWRGVRGVCARLARWRRRARALYADAYLADSLPQLLAPYVRHQLILWNPLADEDNEDYEKMDWYKCLMMYGVRSDKVSSDSDQSSDEEPASVSEEAVRSDLDLMLVPTIVDKVVLPKVTELVEQAWDPVCVRACVRLRSILCRALELPRASCLPRLAAAAHARLAAAIAADVFLPALPPHIVEGPGGVFWRRCLGGGVRLLRATLALCAPPAPLHADPLALKLIDTLSMAAGAAPGPQMAGAAAALADTLPRAGELRRRALRRLAALAQLAASRLQTDNPLHLKALDQTRAILAEAKSVE